MGIARFDCDANCGVDNQQNHRKENGGRGMNTEDYVAYEQAVMLKECGFDWETEHYYEFEELTDTEVVFKRTASCNPFNHNAFAESFSAPSLAQAAKWLREVKGIAINIVAHDGGIYEYEVVFLPNAEEYDDDIDRSPFRRTYEEALSEGIDAVLRLLITKRQ